MNKDIRELEKYLLRSLPIKKCNWTYRSKHIMLDVISKNSKKIKVFVAKTPSDYRLFKNIRSEISKRLTH